MGPSLTDGTMLHRESRGAAEVRQGTACRALRGRWRRSQRRRAPSGEETEWTAYLFFSFFSPKLSAAELMQ